MTNMKKKIMGVGAVVISAMALVGVGKGIQIMMQPKEEEPREKQITL